MHFILRMFVVLLHPHWAHKVFYPCVDNVYSSNRTEGMSCRFPWHFIYRLWTWSRIRNKLSATNAWSRYSRHIHASHKNNTFIPPIKTKGSVCLFFLKSSTFIFSFSIQSWSLEDDPSSEPKDEFRLQLTFFFTTPWVQN